MERDHVWPKKWGGPDARWNYQVLCRRHNRQKGARWADYRLRNLVLALMLGWVLLYGW
jgi:5-methylcytosine-specific restriction endonuclease McrA